MYNLSIWYMQFCWHISDTKHSISFKKEICYSIAEATQLHLWSANCSLLASGLWGAQGTESLVLRNKAQTLESRIKEFGSTWGFSNLKSDLGHTILINTVFWTFICQHGGSDGKESACNAGDLGSILWPGRYPGEGNGNPFHYSCLENSLDGGVWGATVHELQRVGHVWATNTYTHGDGNCRTGPGQAAESDNRLY